MNPTTMTLPTVAPSYSLPAPAVQSLTAPCALAVQSPATTPKPRYYHNPYRTSMPPTPHAGALPGCASPSEGTPTAAGLTLLPGVLPPPPAGCSADDASRGLLQPPTPHAGAALGTSPPSPNISRTTSGLVAGTWSLTEAHEVAAQRECARQRTAAQAAAAAAEADRGQQQLRAAMQREMVQAPTPTAGPQPVVVHAALAGRLSYMPMPRSAHKPDLDDAGRTGVASSPKSVGMYTSAAFRAHQRSRGRTSFGSTVDLFIAQLPFDMPLSMLQYVATAAGLQVTILHAAPHHQGSKAYDGCAFVKVPRDDAGPLAQTLHKSALFDVNGVWIATTPEQRDYLARYCLWMQEQPPRERRQLLSRAIPFSSVTVEAARRSYIF